MVAIKESHKFLHLYGFAFLGGTCLSFVELADLIKHNPGDINLYFFIGMFIAGIFGIFGFIIGGNDKFDRKASFMVGMSAPQIIGGVIKGGTIATVKTTAFFSLLVTPSYAGDTNMSLMPDTGEIVVTVEGTHEEVTIIDEKTKEEYTVTYEEPVIVPRSGKYSVRSRNVAGKSIEVDDYRVDSTNQINILFVKKQRTLSVFQGLFSGQHKNHGAITQKIEVQQKNIPFEDSVEEDSVIVEDSLEIPEEDE